MKAGIRTCAKKPAGSLPVDTSTPSDAGEAVQKYYTGHYLEAIARLRGYLGERHRPRFAATASFFLGASLVSVSLRSKEDASPGLGAARQHFRESQETDPEFVAPLESVSPKVRAVFSEAVGQ